MKNTSRFAVLFLIPISLMLFSGCKYKGSVTNLYKFPDTKIVQVHVAIDFKLASGSGPALGLDNNHFLLDAFALDADGAQVLVAPVGQTPIVDLPITMPGAHDEFDAWLQIPSTVQPRATGYAFRFQLKPAGATLVDTAGVNLQALRGDVQAGTDPSSNLVEINLATTLAAKLTTKLLADPGTVASLAAYDAIVKQLSSRLHTIEGTADATKAQDLVVYAQAVTAVLELQALTDKTFQGQLVGPLSAVVAADGGVSSTALAQGLTSSLKDFATDASTYLGSATTAQAQVFKAGTVDPATVPNPATYTGAVFGPIAVTYKAATATAGGSATITPPSVTAGVSSYNVYFGGATLATSHKKLLGNVPASANPLVLTLPAGTTVPADATTMWAYSVTADGTELAWPAAASLPSNPTPSQTPSQSGLTVTVSADSHLSVTPAGAQVVQVGANLAVTVTAIGGYTVSQTVGGTCALGVWSGSSYTTGAVTSACTLVFSSVAPFQGKPSFVLPGHDEFDQSPTPLVLDANNNAYFAYSTNGNAVTGTGPSASGGYDGVLVKVDPTGTKVWTRQISVSGGNMMQIMGLVITSQGSIYACGRTNANLAMHSSLPSGEIDAMILKFDSSGNQIWAQQFGVSGALTIARGCDLDASENLYVIGETTGNLSGAGQTGSQDAFILKVSSSGTAIWKKQFGVASQNDSFTSVRVDSTHSTFYLTGYGTGNLQTNSPPTLGNVAFIMKYDLSGNLIWQNVKDLGGNSLFYPQDLWVDPMTLNIYVALFGDGNWTTGVRHAGSKDMIIQRYADQGNSVQLGPFIDLAGAGSNKAVEPWSLILSKDHQSLIVSGETTGYIGTESGTMIGLNDDFVAKYDLNLNPIWIKHFGVPGQTTSGGTAVLDAAGNIVAAGTSDGNTLSGTGASNAGSGNSEVYIRTYSTIGVLQ